MKILTDIELRAHWYRERTAQYVVEEDTMITPAARDFLREHHIELIKKGSDCISDECKKDADKTADRASVPDTSSPFGKMPMTPVPTGADHKPKYVIAATGAQVSEKPENMTHLNGNVLVSKSHPQIVFRGKIDSLQAKIMEVQQIALSENREDMSAVLEGLLLFVRQILGSEVMDTPLGDIKLLGLSSSEIRHMSHHVQEHFGIPHPVPNCKMGKVCVGLNRLRTVVREAELQAVHAFDDHGHCTRQDIVEALNRLSSCVYILFCGELTGKRPYMKNVSAAVSMTHTTASAPTCTCQAEGIMVEASGRHVHLTDEAIKVLFGKDSLTHKSDLSQPGQYAAKERVKLMTSKGEIENVAVLGPARKEVQVEMSLTDARILGINIPVNLSGNLKGAADVILVGPNGIYNAVGSVIASKAHIHMTPEDATKYGVADGDSVSVRLATKRPVTIDDVIIRVNKDFALAMHLDYDEANACQYKKGDLGYIVK